MAVAAAAWRRQWQLGGGSLAVAGAAAVARRRRPAWRWRRKLGGSAVATKTPVATLMAGAQTTINNQLQAVVATATETATMTATMTTIKTMATAVAVAAWRQRSVGGRGSAAAWGHRCGSAAVAAGW